MCTLVSYWIVLVEIDIDTDIVRIALLCVLYDSCSSRHHHNNFHSSFGGVIANSMHRCDRD
jgi:hypothetical protein